MMEQHKKIIKETFECLEKLLKEENIDSDQVLVLLKALENPIADESLNTFRREFQKNIEIALHAKG